MRLIFRKFFMLGELHFLNEVKVNLLHKFNTEQEFQDDVMGSLLELQEELENFLDEGGIIN